MHVEHREGEWGGNAYNSKTYSYSTEALKAVVTSVLLTMTSELILS